MSKKVVLLISGTISTILLVVNYVGTYKVCGGNEDCAELVANIGRSLLIFLSIFILSLITYKLRNEIFRAWIKFSYVWLPLTVILTLLAPEYDSSLLPITKSVVSFSFSAIYLLVSLSIILVKSLSLKSRNSK